MVLACAALVASVVAGPLFANPDVLIDRDRLGEPPPTAALVAAYRALAPVSPPTWTRLDASWTFALGDPREGLNTTLASLPGNRAPVTLPDRTLHADTPYWYVTDVVIAEPSMLAIDADDGAQLYADGKRVPIQGRWFPAPASPDKQRLVVRVINKAMYGGLGGVRVASKADCARYVRQTAVHARLDAIVRKTRLLLAPTPAQIEAAAKAVQDDTDAAVTAAEEVLASEPLTIVGPYLQDAAPDHVSIVWD